MLGAGCGVPRARRRSPGERPEPCPAERPWTVAAPAGLDDEQLDRLAKAAAAELRRRGREAGQKPPAANAFQLQKSGPAMLAGSKSGAPNPMTTVTLGQERLILAASEAGLGAAAIARQVRLPQAAVRRVIALARLSRRRPEP